MLHLAVAACLLASAYGLPEGTKFDVHVITTLSALNKGEHVNSHEFALGDLNVRLTKNVELFSPNYVEQEQVWVNGTRVVSAESSRTLRPQDDCHYNGQVNGQASSLAALSTCAGGFEGILVHDGEAYGLELAEKHLSHRELALHLETAVQKHQTLSMLGNARVTSRSLHVLFRLSSLPELAGGWCGHTAESEKESLRSNMKLNSVDDHDHAHSHAHGHSAQAHSHSSSGTVLSSLSDMLRPRAQQRSSDFQLTAQKYVELTIVNDYGRYRRKSDRTQTDAAAIVNVVNALYNAGSGINPPVKVSLVAQVTFTSSDPWTIAQGSCGACSASSSSNTVGGDGLAGEVPGEVSVDALLQAFNQWAGVPGNVPPSDNHHLLSAYDFQSSVLGYAGVGTMCNGASSGGIDMSTGIESRGKAFQGAILAHEIGHNFGMLHDNDERDGSNNIICPKSGFIMNALVGTAPTLFSPCSFSYYQNWQSGSSSTCISNQPVSLWGDPVCGNGFVETGEDCDCGQSGSCPCCDAATCRFTANSTCAAGPCCNNCQIVTNTSQVCREKQTDCDLVETCDGTSGQCPVDVSRGPGTPCTSSTYGSGTCFGNQCVSLQQSCGAQTVPGTNNRYQACTVSTFLKTGDEFCASEMCQASSGSMTCNGFATTINGENSNIPVIDGVSCSAVTGQQLCLSGKCVAVSQAFPYLFFQIGTWDSCSQCDAIQTRSVSCLMLWSDGTIRPVASEACPPALYPETSRTCVNLTLSCLIAPNDNAADKIARVLVEKLGTSDSARRLVAKAPRVMANSPAFDYNSTEYKKSILYMSMYGALAAFLILVAWIIVSCIRLHQVRPVGMKGRCWHMWLLMLFLTTFAACFACLAMFYNGEFRRGAVNPTIGALPLVQDMISQAYSLALLLQSPTTYLQGPGLTDSRLAQEASAMAVSLLAPTAAALSVLVANTTDIAATQSVVQHPFLPSAAGAQTLTYTCHQCLPALPTLFQSSVNPIITTLQNQAQILGAASHTFSQDFSVTYGGLINTSLNNMNATIAALLELDETMSDVDDMATRYVRLEHTAMIVFFCTIFVLFFLNLFLVICQRCSRWGPKTANLLKHLSFLICVLLMVLFAVALAMATVTNDSCIFLDNAELEENIPAAFNVSTQTAAVATSCMTNASMLAALNVSSVFTATQSVPILSPAQPDFLSAFGVGPLDALNTALNTPVAQYGNTSDVWTLAGGNGASLDQTAMAAVFGFDTVAVANAFTQLNIATSPDYFDESNVTTLDSTAYANQTLVEMWQNDAVTRVNARAQLMNRLADLRVETAAAVATRLALLTATSAANVQVVEAQRRFLNIRNNAASILTNAYCGSIADSYRVFKNSWCTIVNTALSFITLACFCITLLLLPVTVLAHCTRTRILPADDATFEEYERRAADQKLHSIEMIHEDQYARSGRGKK